ncbi:T-cell surface glycoprotein CD3 epsilon chain [Carlito syrichta]|uniref:T-cell surface glycoprotein CD3 epsilon chain n=1 Tax=Carlito syrichta TaxID=1868482 RepID=A0A3Q0DR49_CARSF|nr:T-cell surface glycoprotein CD3 epsilon chain [Carlito syrichta]
MQSGTLWRVLGLCLLAVGAWGKEDDFPQKPYKVSISGTRVVLVCPLEVDSKIKWTKNGNKMSNYHEDHLIWEDFSEVENSGDYACSADNTEASHHIYLKARVCENCIEVDVMAVAIIVIVDICITLGLLMLVYYWSKNRKSKAKPVTRRAGAGGRPKGQKKERPPPVPNPDYEPIRKGQRDLYSGLNQRAV